MVIQTPRVPGYSPSRLKAAFQVDPDVQVDRDAGLSILRKMGKKLQGVTRQDVIWIEADVDRSADDDTKDADMYIEDNLKYLCEKYPFPLTEWVENWYTCIAEDAKETDYNLFLALIRPIPTDLPVSFRMFISRLDLKQNQMVRQQIYEKVYQDENLRQKVIDREPLPGTLTFYTPYSKIRREVLKRLKQDEGTARTPRETGRIFRKICRLMQAEGISFQDALEKVMSLPGIS